MFFFDNYESEKSYFIESVKKNLYAVDNNIFEKLDFYNDNIYLNPFIIASLHDENKDYLSLLVDFYSEKTKHVLIKLGTDKHVYIPEKGTFTFNNFIVKSKLIFDKNSFEFYNLSNNEKIVPVNFFPILKNKFGLEILKNIHPLIKHQFNKKFTLIQNDKYDSFIDKALDIIKVTHPTFFELIIKTVKKIVLYYGEENSFASIETHGVIYLNIRDKESDEIFFVDDIIHQSAHVIFNMLTLRTKKILFTIPYNSPFSDFTFNKGDTGSLYNRFHGLFTQTNINFCLTKCLSICSGKQKIEIIGRIVDNMNMFEGMIYKFKKKEFYRKEGLMWFSFFYKEYNRLYKLNKPLIKKYDVSNQPYVFDYDLFVKTNSNKFEM